MSILANIMTVTSAVLGFLLMCLIGVAIIIWKTIKFLVKAIVVFVVFFFVGFLLGSGKWREYIRK